MFLIWLLTGVASSAGILEPDSTSLWHWFGRHVLLTIILIIFVA